MVPQNQNVMEGNTKPRSTITRTVARKLSMGGVLQQPHVYSITRPKQPRNHKKSEQIVLKLHEQTNIKEYCKQLNCGACGSFCREGLGQCSATVPKELEKHIPCWIPLPWRTIENRDLRVQLAHQQQKLLTLQA